MRVQKLVNSAMKPGAVLAKLKKTWECVHVLIFEEISMISGGVYNMVDFRSMCGRKDAWDVDESNYKKDHCHFGRIPIVIHLGDFLQLTPTAQIGLIQDVNEKDEEGNYKLPEPPTLEVQHAIRVFGKIPDVVELKGTKRFKQGDPLIDFLACMRVGKRIPAATWTAFEKTHAADNHDRLDERHALPKFAQGCGLSMYWDSISRWISRRALRDAKGYNVPLVFLQAVDECNTIDVDAAKRLLNVPNPHNTGDIHGVLPVHVGMRVRLTKKIHERIGLVSETKATVVGFIFDVEDQERYDSTRGGQLFRPRRLPAGIWLEVDDFKNSPISQQLVDRGVHAGRAPGLYCLSPTEVEFTWRSSQVHNVRRIGYPLTHADYMSSTASQGQTIRKGVTIDCARIEPKGRQGMKDADWWLHLYVMFSRATCMADMLLLRPPPRKLLEGGPPPAVKKALEKFEERQTATVQKALELAAQYLCDVPPS